MSNQSCLTDCLKCEIQETKHSLKFKNNKKWITLAKNTQKQSQFQKELIQRQKYQPFIKLYQVPCSKVDTNITKISRVNNIDQYGSRPSRKLTSPNHNNHSIELNKSKVIPPHFIIQSQRVQTRIRSCSLDQTKKPIILQRPIHFIYSQQNLARSISEQKKYTTQNQYKKENEQSKKQQYMISPIIQQSEERYKRSSLFQGAKSIVSRFVTSRKQNQVISTSFDPKTIEKPLKLDVKSFYQNLRLCETQNVITLTNQSMLTSGEQKKNTTKQLSLDQIPMSPETKQIDTSSKFKVGRLLGVGKWAHVYLCQQKQTNYIFAIKQIFKESIQANQSYDKIGKSIDRLINLNSGRLMNIYSKFETKQKLCLLVEYCEKNLYSQLKQKGLFPVQKLMKYSKDIIQAVVFLHQNEIIHGNLNIFQVFINFNECKLKPSIPYSKKQKLNNQDQLKSDIEGLAIIIFEMAHGLVPTLLSVGTFYQKEKLYQDIEMRKKIISFINFKISLPQKDPVYILINDLIKILLEWNTNCRLMASQCINHKFFSLNSLC